MFNLINKRYLFLLISLIVIVPGTISLIFKGLNVGIDFAGGATVQFRPSQDMSANAVQNALKPLKLAELQVIIGSETTVPGNQTAWVHFNVRIDSNVQNVVKQKLQSQPNYGNGLSVLFYDLPLNPPATIGVISFPKGQTASAATIQSALSSLPKTTDVTKTPSSATPAPSPTAQATATATPKATATARATATSKATGTPKLTSTATVVPTATSTPVTNPAATIPVIVQPGDVQVGTTPETVQLLTRTTIDQQGILNLMTAVHNGSGNYIQILQNSSVSPSVATETTQRAFLAVLAASLCILLYVWFAFRKVAKPWRYGACAIIALLHDVLVVLGIFSILGWTAGIQVDSLFITAVLTVVGFSVHDTIVVFDRIRENMQRRTSETFEQVVNASLVQTMARSLNTSLTVLFTLSALTLFGGTSIRSFTLALLIGIFSGTYSSIFNASMLLVMWEKGELSIDHYTKDGGRPREVSDREARELARTRG